MECISSIFLLIAVAFFIIGVVVSYFYYKNIHFSLVKIVVYIAVLCLVDQGIKLYIVNNLDISIVIIEDWLAIKVAKNTYGSFIMSLFDKKLPDLFFLAALLAIYILYRCLYFDQRNGNLFLYSVSLILMCASFISVFLDKAIYGGTYDYIFLYQIAYFDLKDCYLAVALFIVLLSQLYNKSWSEIKEMIRSDPWGIKYFRYEVATWRSLIGKLTGGRKVEVALPETTPTPEQATSKDKNV
jgi:lipoprotein signal peptidase